VLNTDRPFRPDDDDVSNRSADSAERNAKQLADRTLPYHQHTDRFRDLLENASASQDGCEWLSENSEIGSQFCGRWNHLGPPPSRHKEALLHHAIESVAEFDGAAAWRRIHRNRRTQPVLVRFGSHFFNNRYALMAKDPRGIFANATQNLQVGPADAGNEGPAHKIAW
jgi:hypothetical protein